MAAIETTRVVLSSALSGPHFRAVRTTVSTQDVVQYLYRTGGLKSFYTGFGATCCTIVPANLIFFAFYEKLRQREPPASAGVKARACAVVLTAPCEYVRTRLQANAGALTARQLMNTITAFEGLQAFSRGIMITLFRDAPFSAIYWTLNENGKRFLSSRFNAQHNSTRSSFKNEFVYPFISGAVSAAIASTLTQPLDIIKTNIQAVNTRTRSLDLLSFHQNGITHVANEIFRTQGWKGFYVGLFPRLAKIMPSCAVLLATYDFSKAVFSLKPNIESSNVL